MFRPDAPAAIDSYVESMQKLRGTLLATQQKLGLAGATVLVRLNFGKLSDEFQPAAFCIGWRKWSATACFCRSSPAQITPRCWHWHLAA